LTIEESIRTLESFLNISSRRGSDSSGACLVLKKNQKLYFEIFRSQKSSKKTCSDKIFLNKIKYYKNNNYQPLFIMAHTRLSTNGESKINNNNQPILNENNKILIFNGIISNDKDLRKINDINLNTDNDGEWLNYFNYERLANEIKGNYSVIRLNILKDKLELEYFTNNGSQYLCKEHKRISNIILSEKGFFKKLNINHFSKIKINQRNLIKIFSQDKINYEINVYNIEDDTADYVKVIEIQKPKINKNLLIELENRFDEINHNLKRCSKCILTSTHPFMVFDENGVCNFCNNSQQLLLKGKTALEKQLEIYRQDKYGKEKVLLGLSGGRDSSYALHSLVKEFNIKPITYTYDWGLNTDIARKNVAIMTGELGIENIMIAADIRKKRENIKKNINAWLHKPHLGIVPLFMAGDKAFISNANKIKKELSTGLEIFAFNLFEKAQFKEEFSGFKMWNSNTDNLYAEQLKTSSQLKLIFFYGLQFLKNTKYINSSIPDSLQGFFNYYHSNVNILQFFEYLDWDEKIINDTLIEEYGWQTATDTPSTWRIGDGTSSFYNLIYFLFAGFTEHDVLRSTLIRQKKISRDEALSLVSVENKFRYPTLDWYFKLFDLDTEVTLKKIYDLSKVYGKF
ncbi:hypothetical protein N8952_01735, partial [Candidatus Pelagibacter ubique]|nr:hypothetical protein [Candidatus Pelagibacter ubique]